MEIFSKKGHSKISVPPKVSANGLSSFSVSRCLGASQLTPLSV